MARSTLRPDFLLYLRPLLFFAVDLRPEVFLRVLVDFLRVLVDFFRELVDFLRVLVDFFRVPVDFFRDVLDFFRVVFLRAADDDFFRLVAVFLRPVVDFFRAAVFFREVDAFFRVDFLRPPRGAAERSSGSVIPMPVSSCATCTNLLNRPAGS